MEKTPQDDLLIATALSSFSYKFENVDDQVADRAWELAIAHAERQGLHPSEVVHQIDWSSES